VNIVITVAAVLVVVVGIYFSQKEKVNQDNEIAVKEEVLSESDEEPDVIEEEKNIDYITPTNKPFPTAPPIPNQQSPSVSILDFKYPNSQIVSSSSNSMSLESSDNSDSITEWYKGKIDSQGMNVKTFVKTKANDKVLNKLIGADGNKEISIEISKDSMASSVNISITIIEK
jgi:hypothetical protein